MIGDGTRAGVCLAAAGDEVEDDVFSSCDALVADGDNGPGSAVPFVELDHNVYGDGGTSAWIYDANYLTFTARMFHRWRSLAAGDENSRMVASARLSDVGVPLPGSPVVGVGANLSSFCHGALRALCAGITGTPRPASGPWDAGAY